MVLGIDIDGVLANFNSAYGDLLADTNGTDLRPADWKTNPNWPAEWDWDVALGYSKDIIEKTWRRIVKDGRFWERLDPLPGAREALTHVNAVSKAGDDVYFLTNRTGYKAKTQTEVWLYNHGINYPTVVLVSDKVPVIKALNIEFFLDDKLETVSKLMRTCKAQDWLADGRMRYYFLKDAPHNREGRVRGLDVANTLREALEVVGIWR